MPVNVLSQATEGVPGLLGLFLITIPDCLPYQSWTKEDAGLFFEDAVSHFGDLVRLNRKKLSAIESQIEEIQITLEARDRLTILRDLSPDFVLACVFDRDVPLGIIRIHYRQILERVTAQLPTGPAHPAAAPDVQPRIS